MSFANPFALWALLGIPVVLAIHFLQRKSRREVVTTLFLLQQMRRESETGNRIERLRSSIPLWLQLLMVLLFTWLLAAPRWTRADAVLRVAVVLDSSASMQAFRAPALTGLGRLLAGLVGPGARAELTLLSSDPEAPSLYHGSSAMDMLGSAKDWEPLLGVHDFAPALRAARGLAGESGAVVLVTDHPLAAPPPYEAGVLSVGAELQNVGWAGVTVENAEGGQVWRALLKNYGKTNQEREWRAENLGQVSPWARVTLAPGESRTISGPFPGGAGEVTLALKEDDFVLDDRLPVLKPAAKMLNINVPAPSTEMAREVGGLFERYASTQSTVLALADLRVVVWPPSIALEPEQTACVFSSPPKAASSPYLTGPIVAEAHPLVEGLNWQSLLVREGMVVPQDPKERVLLWQGRRPLISLRETPAGKRQLFCHFDLISSNARKLPALAVLLHRFLEQTRQDKVALESGNYDVRQRLVVAHERGEKAAPLRLIPTGGKGALELPLNQARLLRAPARPGFFEVRQGDVPLLRGAAHFADTREADFSQAAPFDDTAGLTAGQVDSIQEADPNWRLWLLLLLGALLASWWWGRDARRPVVQAPSRSTPSPA